MVSQLLQTKAFTDQMIAAEIWLVFFAGSQTIQTSTSNAIYHVLKQPALHERLMKEIRPPLDALNGDIQEGFTYDMAAEFEFAQWCFWESLRLEPPASNTFH